MEVSPKVAGKAIELRTAYVTAHSEDVSMGQISYEMVEVGVLEVWMDACPSRLKVGEITCVVIREGVACFASEES